MHLPCSQELTGADTPVSGFESRPILHLGHAVAQSVEALCYKSEGCGFDSRSCNWNFS